MYRKKDLGYKLSILLSVLAILNLIDWLMTDYAISHGATELNPFSQWLMEYDLFNGFKLIGVIFPILGSSFTGWAESKGYFEEYTWLYNVMGGLILIVTVGYIIVIFNNVMQLSS